MTFSNSTHVCEVGVDVETGKVTIERYLVVEDCGTVLNPLVVRGQQHGAIAMGISGALLEEVVYDENGQNRSGSFADYLLATAVEIPPIEVISQHTPNRQTPDRQQGHVGGWRHGRDRRRAERRQRCARAVRRRRRAPAAISHVPALAVAGQDGSKEQAMTDTKKTDAKTPVAFIGLGMMGAHMAGHILDAGHPLHVYNRTRARAEALIARGAAWHDDAGAAASQGKIVITMVGLPRDVEEIYLGQGGILARAAPGAILIDMTTSSPSLAVRIASAATAKGLRALDAPVSGGDIGARDAKLSIMVGGEAADFERGAAGACN